MLEKTLFDDDSRIRHVPGSKKTQAKGVSMSKNVRKSGFVDAQIQGTLLLRAVFHWTFLVVAAFVVLFVWQVLSGNPHWSLAGHLQATWTRYSPCFIVLVVLQPVVVHDTLKLSNRLAGPLFRLRAAMRSVVEGETVQPVRFRKGDFCQDLARNFNIMLGRIQGEDGSCSDRTDELERV